MNIELIIKQYDFNLGYAKALVHDLNTEQMTMQPGEGLENHPAWTLGHLVSGSAMMVEDLGGEFNMPDGWADLFLRKGPGDARKPDPVREKYPDKEHLLAELERQHEKLKLLLRNTSLETLSKKVKWRFSSYMPTMLDLINFMCVNHEAMHLSQLAAWRRAMKLPSALAKL